MTKFLDYLIVGMVVLFGALALVGTIGYAEPDDHHDCPYKRQLETLEVDEPNDPGVEQEQSICPETKMDSKCLYCHTQPTFAVKEADPHDLYDYPITGINDFHFVFGDVEAAKIEKLDQTFLVRKPIAGYLVMKDVDASTLQKVMDYCNRHEVTYLTIELFTPGGGLGEAYKIVGLIRNWQAMGKTLETRCYGFAASAGFLVFASGSEGYRLVSPQAELMWHELQALTAFAIETPSDKEDEARILRHLQDTANSWLAEVSHKTKEEIDALVYKTEYWINGEEAVEEGFADGYIR